jgi:hypothetical protein
MAPGCTLLMQARHVHQPAALHGRWAKIAGSPALFAVAMGTLLTPVRARTSDSIFRLPDMVLRGPEACATLAGLWRELNSSLAAALAVMHRSNGALGDE